MENISKAMFGAGCFWGVQYSFDRVKGVLKTTVGYSGGKKKDPTYQEVCRDNTGHAEVILIEFDNSIISYKDLLEHLFSIHDPTTVNSQGVDIGSQYRSSIMYFDDTQKNQAIKTIEDLDSRKKFRSKIVTEVVKASEFYPAEEYHQKYNDKHGYAGCNI